MTHEEKRFWSDMVCSACQASVTNSQQTHRYTCPQCKEAQYRENVNRFIEAFDDWKSSLEDHIAITKIKWRDVERARASLDEISANEEIKRLEAMGYDYSQKPDHYSLLDWCGQCNRSIKSYDYERCNCVISNEIDEDIRSLFKSKTESRSRFIPGVFRWITRQSIANSPKSFGQ